LNLNMLLYVVLFFIILGLFLASLVRSKAGTRRSREDTSVPGTRQTDPKDEPEDKGK
jgi:hypothetical protein